jgi:hypothetical protein
MYLWWAQGHRGAERDRGNLSGIRESLEDGAGGLVRRATGECGGPRVISAHVRSLRYAHIKHSAKLETGESCQVIASTFMRFDVVANQ